MKRKNLLMVLLLFALAFLFVGCKPEPVEEKPILVVGTVELETEEGSTVKISASITNTDEQFDLEFASDKTAIATVDTSGNVTAKAPGQAIITVSIKDHSEQKAEVKVKVLAKPTPPDKGIVEEFAPTSVTIMGQDSVYEGDTEKFLSMVLPQSAYQRLVWSSSNPAVASVDAEGNVTGHQVGKAIIMAYSAIAPEVKGEYEVTVKETGEDSDIGAKALDYIKSAMPKYVTESFVLPVYPNPDVSIVWKDGSGVELEEGEYIYDENLTEDKNDAVICVIEYGYFSAEESIPLKVIADPDNNNFANLELIKIYLDVFFADHIANKVTGDMVLPTALKGTTITWTTSKSAIISTAGVYTKPNNDANVKLSALVKSGPISTSYEYDLVAKGYTEQEKIDYLLTQGVLKPIVDLESNANITLPTYDPRFGLTISWESANRAIFDDAGVYSNRDLAEDTDVKFVASFKEGNKAFELNTEITVKALAATDVSKAVFDFLRNDTLISSVPQYFPYGLPGRANGNEIVGLPVAMEGHEGVAITWEGNPDDFDGLTLKSQYLRYHETYLTATFSKEGVVSTSIKVLLNTGLAEDAASLNIGGRFSEQSGTDPNYKYDLLNTFSYWDKYVGDTAYKGQQYWSYYSGYTWYIDAETDGTSTLEQKAAGEGRRYQYFAMDFVVLYILEVDDAGEVTKWDKGNLRDGDGGNWAIFFVNLSGKEAKVPLATHGAGQGTDGKDWQSTPGREHAITFDGFRKGFVADKDGKITLGSSFGVLQDVLPSTTTHIPIPSEGYGMTFKTQENQPIVGVFCQPETTITIQKFNLAPENDYRAIRYKSNLNNAETGIVAREAEEDTDVDIELAIKNALFYKNNLRLTEFELGMFDLERLDDIIERNAALWDADIEDIKTKSAEEGYLVELKKLYDKYLTVSDEVKAVCKAENLTWLETEYDEKLKPRKLTVHLNDGTYYTESRQEVVDLFMADFYKHLQDKGYEGLPDTVAGLLELIAATEDCIMTDAFLAEWVFELEKDNANHLTVDNEAKQFIRQAAYNEKWTPLLKWLNDTVQTGHNGGRDFLGRVGKKYLFTYLTATSYSGDVVYVANTYSSRLKEYILGKYAYPAFKEAFLEETWTIDSAKAQQKIDDANLTYTGGDTAIVIPEPVNPGFVFEGWYLDENLTNKATLTPAGLGLQDVNLYAKWEAE